MADVELTNIVGRYGDFLAVDDVSFSIRSGEFVTLLGPSGCGKSSTLRIVAGLLPPSSGTVLFGGRDVTALAPAKRNIGMVFQSLALFPHLTVSENVAFGLKMKGVAPDARATRVKRTLEIVRLGHLAQRYPAQLSGGQQQRVALARAVAIQPSILILDEPFGALDRKLREAMQVELHALTRELGITALFVTHDQEEALMLSDKIAVMNGGRLEQFGKPGELYAKPRTPFVADFMGVTNLMRGIIKSRLGSSSLVTIAGCDIEAPSAPTLSDESIILAIRPEKVRLSVDTWHSSDAPRVAGKVQHVTYHGGSCRYVLRLDSGETLVAIEQIDDPSKHWKAGTQVWASWRPADSLLFPSEPTSTG